MPETNIFQAQVHHLEIVSLLVSLWSLNTDVGISMYFVGVMTCWCNFIMKTVVTGNVYNFMVALCHWVTDCQVVEEMAVLPEPNLCWVPVCLPSRLGTQCISLGILLPCHLHGLHKNMVIVVLRAADGVKGFRDRRSINSYFISKLWFLRRETWGEFHVPSGSLMEALSKQWQGNKDKYRVVVSLVGENRLIFRATEVARVCGTWCWGGRNSLEKGTKKSSQGSLWVWLSTKLHE